MDGPQELSLAAQAPIAPDEFQAPADDERSKSR